MKSTMVKFSQQLEDNLPDVEELRNFVKGRIWKYLEATLMVRIEGCRDDLERGQSDDLDTLRINQGRAEELRFIAAYPQFLIDNYENLKDEIKMKQEEKDGK
jgi:hypothetical protein